MQFITNLIIPLSVSVVVCNLILKSRHTSQAMFCLYYCMKICMCSFDNNCVLDKNESIISGSCYCICTSLSDIYLLSFTNCYYQIGNNYFPISIHFPRSFRKFSLKILKIGYSAWLFCQLIRKYDKSCSSDRRMDPYHHLDFTSKEVARIYIFHVIS